MTPINSRNLRNWLGSGFVKAIYQRALLHELQLRGFAIETERQLDMVVQQCVVVELKAAGGTIDARHGQAISYLKASGLEVALILNFGEPSLVFKRVVRSRQPDNHIREV